MVRVLEAHAGLVGVTAAVLLVALSKWSKNLSSACLYNGLLFQEAQL